MIFHSETATSHTASWTENGGGRLAAWKARKGTPVKCSRSGFARVDKVVDRGNLSYESGKLVVQGKGTAELSRSCWKRILSEVKMGY